MRSLVGWSVTPRRQEKGLTLPNVTSGNTNAPSIMIDEKAAEMIARDYGVKLRKFVGEHSVSRH